MYGTSKLGDAMTKEKQVEALKKEYVETGDPETLKRYGKALDEFLDQWQASLRPPRVGSWEHRLKASDKR